MSIFKQAINSIRSKNEETNQNTRRIAQNFPLIERKNDNIVFDKPYEMEFPLSEHPHEVKLNMYFKPPDTCFKCNAGISPSFTEDSFAQAQGNTTDGDGAIIYTGFTTNVGGFGTNFPDAGLVVPRDGYYNVRFSFTALGVVTTESAGVVASVRHNGVVISQKVHSVINGKLPPPLAGMGTGFDFFGICIPIRGGDTVGGWVQAGGIAGFGITENFTQIILVGLA